MENTIYFKYTKVYVEKSKQGSLMIELKGVSRSLRSLKNQLVNEGIFRKEDQIRFVYRDAKTGEKRDLLHLDAYTKMTLFSDTCRNVYVEKVGTMPRNEEIEANQIFQVKELKIDGEIKFELGEFKGTVSDLTENVYSLFELDSKKIDILVYYRGEWKDILEIAPSTLATHLNQKICYLKIEKKKQLEIRKLTFESPLGTNEYGDFEGTVEELAHLPRILFGLKEEDDLVVKVFVSKGKKDITKLSRTDVDYYLNMNKELTLEVESTAFERSKNEEKTENNPSETGLSQFAQGEGITQIKARIKDEQGERMQERGKREEEERRKREEEEQRKREEEEQRKREEEEQRKREEEERRKREEEERRKREEVEQRKREEQEQRKREEEEQRKREEAERRKREEAERRKREEAERRKREEEKMLEFYKKEQLKKEEAEKQRKQREEEEKKKREERERIEEEERERLRLKEEQEKRQEEARNKAVINHRNRLFSLVNKQNEGKYACSYCQTEIEGMVFVSLNQENSVFCEKCQSFHIHHCFTKKFKDLSVEAERLFVVKKMLSKAETEVKLKFALLSQEITAKQGEIVKIGLQVENRGTQYVNLSSIKFVCRTKDFFWSVNIHEKGSVYPGCIEFLEIPVKIESETNFKLNIEPVCSSINTNSLELIIKVEDLEEIKKTISRNWPRLIPYKVDLVASMASGRGISDQEAYERLEKSKWNL